MDKDYERKYGEVPDDYIKRLVSMLRKGNFKEKDIKKLRERMREILGMTTTTINMTINMVPKATPRPRMVNGHTYVKDASKNSKFFKAFLEEKFPDQKLITTPCTFIVDLFMPTPNMSRIDTILAELKLIKVVSRPDWDNLGKTYSDMVQRHLMIEDSVINIGMVRKFYSTKPRIELTIKYDNNYDSLYNKRKIESWNIYDALDPEEIDVV